jgi:hypothetical protein
MAFFNNDMRADYSTGAWNKSAFCAKLQTPITKHQRIPKLQTLDNAARSVEAWLLGLLWGLEIGAWCFSFRPLPPATFTV